MHSIFTQTAISNLIYHYLHSPVAWIKFIFYSVELFIFAERDCEFRGEYQCHNQMAMSRPIPVNQFKSIAKKHKVRIVSVLYMVCM